MGPTPSLRLMHPMCRMHPMCHIRPMHTCVPCNPCAPSALHLMHPMQPMPCAPCREAGLGPAEPAEKDEDVAAEESRVKALLNHRTGGRQCLSRITSLGLGTHIHTHAFSVGDQPAKWSQGLGEKQACWGWVQYPAWDCGCRVVPE